MLNSDIPSVASLVDMLEAYSICLFPLPSVMDLKAVDCDICKTRYTDSKITHTKMLMAKPAFFMYKGISKAFKL